ncbi:hypothetical protein Q604_UNBC09003G0001, partial [human gut metagenome]
RRGPATVKRSEFQKPLGNREGGASDEAKSGDLPMGIFRLTYER